MVEPGRSAGAREATKTTSTAVVKKKKPSKKRPEEKEKEIISNGGSRKQQQSSRQCTEVAAVESPSYRLALKSIFSCRNSHHHLASASPSPAADTTTGKSSSSKKLGGGGCSSAPSICKLNKQDSSDTAPQHKPLDQPPTTAAEPCKRRASVSGGSSSERRVKKPLKEAVSSSTSSKQLVQRGGGSSLSSSSSSTAGSSFRAGMQLRRLSGCYECHMVVDPISGAFSSSSMRAATICPCPDCGEIFVRQEALQLHQSIRHAVCELEASDTSRNIIEIIFQSSWLKKQNPPQVQRILKVHNTPRTLARFEDYRHAVKAKCSANAKKHPRCAADGNELLRFHCAALACDLGLHGATHLCSSLVSDEDHGDGGCAACGVIRHGFRAAAAGDGVRTTATSGRAHDAVVGGEQDDEQRGVVRAMLVCRVIAGRVKRPQQQVEDGDQAEETGSPPASSPSEDEYESVAGSAGVYSNLEELQVFNPRAILPCFVVVYKA